MEENKRNKGRIIKLIIAGIVLSLIMSFLYKLGYIPFVGRFIAEKKLEAYASARLDRTDPVRVKYDWYNGIYYCSSYKQPVLRYQLRNNTIFDGDINEKVNTKTEELYKSITDEFPSNIEFPKAIFAWTTISADDYEVLAQRLYLLEVYNTADLMREESREMPARIGLDFISCLGDDYYITGIQLIYGDRNGMYEIAISPDTFKALEYKQMIKATKERTGRELPESYFKWMEKNGFNM